MPGQQKILRRLVGGKHSVSRHTQTSRDFRNGNIPGDPSTEVVWRIEELRRQPVGTKRTRVAALQRDVLAFGQSPALVC